MVAVCHYLWTWHFSAHHVSQLGIQLISTMIQFNDSCHSFEYFIRMHCPLSHCVFVPFSHATKYFYRVARCSKGIWRSFNSAVYIVFCVSIFESVLWLLHSHLSITMFRVSCHRCGTHHGPPLTRLFPLTSAHYLGNSLRNNIWYLEICMP